jgi:hypothetical protein
MKYKSVFVQAPTGTMEVRKLFGGTKTVQNTLWIDAPALAKACESACNELASAGYEVISIVDINRGTLLPVGSGAAGWSVTQGLLITAKHSA